MLFSKHKDYLKQARNAVTFADICQGLAYEQYNKRDENTGF